MNARLKLPPNRTYEQIRNHYEVEKAIAQRLKKANRTERKRMYATMYNELFEKVPDHFRLERRESETLTRAATREKMALVRSSLKPNLTFAEFAPGDCRFSMEVCRRVAQVYCIDISDQRSPSAVPPPNFRLIVYDGYNLDDIPGSSIDIVFSDQLIEHFHPEDTQLHFQLANRILRKHGKYIFRTPNCYSGPHDISKYFSDVPEGFHLKEWSYTGIKPELRQAGFSRMYARKMIRGRPIPIPYWLFEFLEAVLERLPPPQSKMLARLVLKDIIITAIK